MSLSVYIGIFSSLEGKMKILDKSIESQRQTMENRLLRHPKKSFLTMLICLRCINIKLPRDIRQILFDYVVIKNPLFRKTHSEQFLVFPPLMLYKREINVPVRSFTCVDISAFKGASWRIVLVLNLVNPQIAKFIERTENALFDEKVKLWHQGFPFQHSLTESSDGWSLKYEYPVTNCAYHPEGPLESVTLLRHGWCGHHDICLATFHGVLKRGEAIDFPIVLTVDGLTVNDNGVKMLFRLEEKTEPKKVDL